MDRAVYVMVFLFTGRPSLFLHNIAAVIPLNFAISKGVAQAKLQHFIVLTNGYDPRRSYIEELSRAKQSNMGKKKMW